MMTGDLGGRLGSRSVSVAADVSATNAALNELMSDFRLTDSSSHVSDLRAPWGVRLPASGRGAYHFVAKGGGHLCAPGGGVIELRPGDFVLLPHGPAHDVVDRPGSTVDFLAPQDTDACIRNDSRIDHRGSGVRSVIVSGSVQFDPHPILAELPETLLVPGSDGSPRQRLHATAAALAAEVSAGLPGSDLVIARLSEVLVVTAIRTWLDSARIDAPGLLLGLRDPGLAQALSAIHTEPGRVWTVETLAAQANMSRSSFARLFHESIGEPPMQYLTRRRMALAELWVRKGEGNLSEIASRLGYSSAAAFSRAFKHHTGHPPGSLARQRASQGPPTS